MYDLSKFSIFFIFQKVLQLEKILIHQGKSIIHCNPVKYIHDLEKVKNRTVLSSTVMLLIYMYIYNLGNSFHEN